ncbi:MAG: FHA domain-containing protein [Anaerolineae bacterium]
MDIITILWSAAGALLVLVLFQIVYLAFLNALPTRRRDRGNRAVAPAAAPVGSPFAEPPAEVPSRVLSGSPMQDNPPYAVPPPVVQTIPTNQPTPPPSTSRRAQQTAAPLAAAPTPAPTPVMTPAPPPAIPVPNLPQAASAGTRKMTVLSGLPELFEINLPGNEFGIGRFFNQERKVLVMFDEKSVSREHALFAYNAQLDQYFVTDKSSSYGTYVLVDNKFEPLSPERPERIFNGDVVQFGNVVKVRFLLPGETRASMTAL